MRKSNDGTSCKWSADLVVGNVTKIAQQKLPEKSGILRDLGRDQACPKD